MDRKKTLDRITYLVNILIALPVFGLIGCGVFGLVYAIAFPCRNPPEWAAWFFPIALDLLLTGLWGWYQYRLIFLQTPRPPHETRRTLVILAVCVAIAFALIFGLAYRIRTERMKEARETAKAERDLAHTSWRSFYGAVGLKSWVADPAVEYLARKFLQLDFKAGERVHDKVMFPFAVKFVAADGDARILFFNTGHCSFDRKTQYPHHLSGEEIERFYCTVGAQKRTEPAKKEIER